MNFTHFGNRTHDIWGANHPSARILHRSTAQPRMKFRLKTADEV